MTLILPKNPNCFECPSANACYNEALFAEQVVSLRAREHRAALPAISMEESAALRTGYDLSVNLDTDHDPDVLAQERQEHRTAGERYVVALEELSNASRRYSELTNGCRGMIVIAQKRLFGRNVRLEKCQGNKNRDESLQRIFLR